MRRDLNPFSSFHKIIYYGKNEGGIIMYKYYPLQMFLPIMGHAYEDVYRPTIVPIHLATEGDMVYDRLGKLHSIKSICIMNNSLSMDEYEILFSNGTKINALSENVLHIEKYPCKNISVYELAQRFLSSKEKPSFHITPIQKDALKWKDSRTAIKPYSLGVLLMACDMEERILRISDRDYYENAGDEFIARKVATLEELEIEEDNGWVFRKHDDCLFLTTKEFFRYYSRDPKNQEKYYTGIPYNYLYASYENRRELVKGIFDVAGEIVAEQTTYGYRYSYKIKIYSELMSKDLRYDLMNLLTSLGFILSYDKEYNIIVQTHYNDFAEYFSNPELYYKALNISDLKFHNNPSYEIKDIKVVNFPETIVRLEVDTDNVLVGNYIPC